MRIRDAGETDLAGLCDLEARSFATDRLSRRSLRRFLRMKSASLRAAAAGGAIAGYHLVLMRRGSAIARLYSIAVADGQRGTGLAQALMADAERIAEQRGCHALRLEVRPDNRAAIRLYERLGYRKIGVYPKFYADKADAVRYEKLLGAAAESPANDDEDRSPPDIDAISILLSGDVAPVTPAAGVVAAKV